MGNLFKKEFLLGIGVGCILSAFLVSALGMGIISDQEVITRAAKLGMVKQSMPWKNNQSANPSQPPAADTTQNSDQSQTSNQSQNSDQPQNSNQSQTSDQSQSSDPSQTPKQSKVNPVTTTITISDRMGSESVARALERKGVIDDQDEFLRVVNSHNAQRRFQTGTFTVPVGGDLVEILNILIGKKK